MPLKVKTENLTFSEAIKAMDAGSIVERTTEEGWGVQCRKNPAAQRYQARWCDPATDDEDWGSWGLAVFTDNDYHCETWRVVGKASDSAGDASPGWTMEEAARALVLDAVVITGDAIDDVRKRLTVKPGYGHWLVMMEELDRRCPGLFREEEEDS